MATQNTLTGTLFAGRYRVTRKIGGGGMADVYLAEDQELGRRVAIKILHSRYANDDQFVERFRREATHAAGLSHPNIVSIFDRGETDGSYFIVMEYVEGRTLKELIRSRGPCPIPVAIAYTRQILAALRYAHRNGGADLGLVDRRQDGNGRDGGSGLEHDVVHSLREQGRERPCRARDRGRAPEPAGHRRGVLGPDRPRGDGGNPPLKGESLTSRSALDENHRHSGREADAFRRFRAIRSRASGF
jgi:hypothetical protein